MKKRKRFDCIKEKRKKSGQMGIIYITNLNNVCWVEKRTKLKYIYRLGEFDDEDNGHIFYLF